MEKRIPDDHPLRPIRLLVDEVFERMTRKFSALYSEMGRPSIPPEQLLRALILQIVYSIRSERQLVEQIDFNLLFRWFVGLKMDDAVWSATTFSKNRDRLLEGKVAERFFQEVLLLASRRRLISNEHFTVDGTLVEAWASMKSFQKKGKRRKKPQDPGNPSVSFHGEKRRNDTHESTTDPEAMLYRKGNNREARLCYAGHVLMENRNGLAVGVELTRATGTAERDVAQDFAIRLRRTRKGRVSLGADKGYDTRKMVGVLRKLGIIPHLAKNPFMNSPLDERTMRHESYEISQRSRKKIEEIFGWLKTIGPMRKTRFRGRTRVSWMLTFSTAIYNLIRIRNLCYT